MSATTRATAPVAAKLTAALTGFLTTYALPDPDVVDLDLHSGQLRIQPAVTAWTNPVAVLSSLLLWTRGLSGITATWRRYDPPGPDSDRVHISIHGRLASGVQVTVYKGLPYLGICEWVHLGRDREESVSLDELAWLVSQLHTARPTL